MSCTGVQKLLWRRQMLHDNEVPRQSEVRALLGSPLSEIFFSNLDDSGKKAMGLKPELNGPGRDLWISPSDLLSNKVKLTIPLTRKYTRALTHQGIMEMGTTIMDKYEKEKEREKRKAVIEAQRAARLSALEERRTAIEKAVEEEREKHDIEKEVLVEQFNRTIQEAMDVTKCRFEDKMKITVQIERAEVANLLDDKMDFALENQEVELMEQIRTEEMLKVNALNKEYQDFILENKQKMDDKLQSITDEYKYKLDEIYKKMEDEKLNDIANAIQKEREQYLTEIEELRKGFDNERSKLNIMIEEKQSEVETLEALATKTSQHMKAWEGKARMIYHEFQKFINFSLKAVPGQAEYLLSLEKLLADELEQSISEEESEAICSTTEEYFRITAGKEIATSIVDEILRKMCEKTDLSSCTALFSTRVSLVKILDGLYNFVHVTPEEETLHEIVKTVFNISNIQLDKQSILNVLNQLPTDIILDELSIEIKQIIDEFTAIEILLKTLIKIHNSIHDSPSIDSIKKILDGVYNSEDMNSCKDTVTKILERVYKHAEVLPIRDIIETLLMKTYENIDLYYGRKILLKVLDTVYISPDLNPENINLVNLVEVVYNVSDNHPVKSLFPNIITNMFRSEKKESEIAIDVDTYEIVNLREQVLEFFETYGAAYDHPGKNILLGVLRKIYEVSDEVPTKTVIVNILDRAFYSMLENTCKEILFKVVDGIYKFEKPHHIKDVMTEILDSITKEDLVHPGKQMYLEILEKVKEIVTEKSLNETNDIKDILECVLINVFKTQDVKCILHEIIRKISDEHIHPGRQIVLEILEKVDLIEPPLKKGSEVFSSVQDIIARIIDGINKAENVFSKQDLLDIVFKSLGNVSISQTGGEQSETDEKVVKIINAIQDATLQPAIVTMDEAIDTVFQATENVEQAIQDIEVQRTTQDTSQIVLEEMKLSEDDEINFKKNSTVPFCERGLVGEGGTEHLDTTDEFLSKRLNSLIRIFHEHVSLANLVIPPGGIS